MMIDHPDVVQSAAYVDALRARQKGLSIYQVDRA